MVIIGRPLIRLDAVTSTMDIASRMAADGAGGGTTVVARHQMQGRGRQDRAWTDRPGESLLFSFIHRSDRPLHEMGPLAPLLGVAVARSVSPLCARSVAVKWPNDVLVGHRKIAGILVTARPAGQSTVLIVGIGLNVNQESGSLPDGATSLALESGSPQDPAVILERVLADLGDVVTDFEHGCNFSASAELQEWLAWRGEAVQVAEGCRTISGIVREVAFDGALVLEGADGEPLRIVAGSLTRGPRPISQS